MTDWCHTRFLAAGFGVLCPFFGFAVSEAVSELNTSWRLPPCSVPSDSSPSAVLPDRCSKVLSYFKQKTDILTSSFFCGYSVARLAYKQIERLQWNPVDALNLFQSITGFYTVIHSGLHTQIK